MKAADVKAGIWRVVTDRSLSTFIMIAVTSVLVIGSLLPNPAYMSPAKIAHLQSSKPLLYALGKNFNSQKLASGYIFGFLCIYLIVSATLCSIDRILAKRRETAAPPLDPGLATLTSKEGVTLLVPAGQEETGEFITDWLRQRLVGQWSWRHQATGSVIAKRGRYGFWGSILFHSVLITSLFGMGFLYLGGTRGKLIFTEGQRYLLEKSRITRLAKEPIWGMHLPKVELELMEQQSLFAADIKQTATEHRARFRIHDLTKGTTTTEDVKINKPLYLAGLDFLLMTGGFSPRFVITRADGAVVYDKFVNLLEDAGTSDKFFATDDRLYLRIRFFPDLEQQTGQPESRSLQLKNPAVALTVLQQDRELLKEIVPIGGRAQVAGYGIAIPEVRRWVELEMVNEPGLGFFFIMGFVGIIGILVRVLDPDEQLTIVMSTAGEDTTIINLVPDSRHFSALLDGIVGECAEAVTVWSKNKPGERG